MKTLGMKINPILRLITVVWILIGLISASNMSAFSAEKSTTVRVKDRAWVKGEKVFLRDVAKINGESHIIEALGDIYLAYAPSPGKEKQLHGEWIRSKIRSKAWVPENTRITVSEFINVGRRFQRVSDERFRQLYSSRVREEINGQSDDFQVRRFKVLGNRALPEGKLRINLVDLAAGEYVGNVTLTAVIYVDGKLERRVSLSGWVDRFEEVVCSRESLARHSVLSLQNLCLKRKNVSKLSNQIMRNPELAVGKRLKHHVKAGSILKINGLEDVPVIMRGDRVNIVVESDTLRITAEGIAEDRGTIGDKIRVTNVMGKKEIVAAIVDSSTVKIEF